MVFNRLSNSCKLFFLLQAQLCMQWKFGFRVINHWRFAPTYCRCTLEFYFTLFLRKCRNYQYVFFQLMKLGQKMLGKKLFGEIMKRTFYGQFVAGPVCFFVKVQANFDQAWSFQDTVGITPTIARMHSFGVKSILDYSVEEDISQEEAEQREME